MFYYEARPPGGEWWCGGAAKLEGALHHMKKVTAPGSHSIRLEEIEVTLELEY